MPAATKKRARAATSEAEKLEAFESELAQILEDDEYGSASDRLHLAADLWDGKAGEELPDFFDRMRQWVQDHLVADSSEALIFASVETLDEEQVKTALAGLPEDAEANSSVDEEEAAEALALPTAKARQIRLLRFLLEDADEYELVEGGEALNRDKNAAINIATNFARLYEGRDPIRKQTSSDLEIQGLKAICSECD